MTVDRPQRSLAQADAGLLFNSLGPLPMPEAQPTLIMISGLPGTGKTYFAKKLQEKLGFIILESDALRKVLFYPPAYSAEESSRLFRAVHFLIERLLKLGVSLIFDATNLSEYFREYLYSIVERLNVKLVIVSMEAPPDLVRERLDARALMPGHASDADWDIYLRMRPTAEKIQRPHYIVDSSRDIMPVLEKIVRRVRKQE